LHFVTQVRLVLLYDEVGRSGRSDFRDHLEQWMQLLFAHDPRETKYHVITVSVISLQRFSPAHMGCIRVYPGSFRGVTVVYWGCKPPFALVVVAMIKKLTLCHLFLACRLCPRWTGR